MSGSARPAVRLLVVATLADSVRAFLLPFAQHFRKLGWRVDVMAKGSSASAECRQAFDRVWDVEWSRSPLSGANLRLGLQLARAGQLWGEYDLVHVHTPVASFVSRYAARRPRRQGRPCVIYTAHGFHFHSGGRRLQNLVYLGLEKVASRWTDYLVVINQEDYDSALQYRLAPAGHVCYMPGIGVDTDLYSPVRVLAGDVASFRATLGLTPEQPLFLMVAEFTPNKRHADAVKAFALVQRRDARLALAGDGPERAAVEALAASLGVADKVRFLGERTDIPTLMRASVATLLLSAREGLPRAVLESLSLAIPVIGTDIRGTRDLLNTGAGMLVDVGDTRGLACAMEWLLYHPREARAMGERGRGHVRSHDVRTILRLHEDLYDAALAGASCMPLT